MTNFIKGHITLVSIAEMKTAMQWFQTNYPNESTGLKLHAEGEDLRVDFNFTVADLDAGIAAVNAILAEYPTALWNADFE